MIFRRKSERRRPRLISEDHGPAPPAVSYRARRSEETRNPSRQAQPAELLNATKDLGVSWLQRFGLLILMVVVLASLVNILSLTDTAKVVPLTTDKSQPLLRPTAAYQQAANQALRQKVWNRNKITIDTGQLSRQLLKQFPELNGVSVTVPLLAHQPIVYVEPAQPALILAANNGAFVVSSSGKALLKAGTPDQLQQPTLPVVSDQSSLSASLDHQVLARSSVRFIQTVVAQLAAKQFSIAGLVLPPGASELDVHLNGKSYFIKFNLESNDPTGEAGTFLATISQLQHQNITPASYVDVRVPGRAYYK